MNGDEAKQILDRELAKVRVRSYAELAGTVGDSMLSEIEGSGGATYQIAILVVWDREAGGNLRVIGSIDDGGWRAFVPLTDDFILAPDGSFVDDLGECAPGYPTGTK